MANLLSEPALERFHPDLTIRSDGRTVHGIVMPYDVEAVVNDGDGRGDYVEVFRMGAFAKAVKERSDKIKLVVNHDKFTALPIGRSERLREDKRGLHGEFRISPTVAGDETLTLIRDGAVDAFSAGFLPVRPSRREPIPRSGIVERTEATLDHVAVVGFPAYEGARIAGVRSQFDAIWAELDDDERAAVRDLDLLTLIRQATRNTEDVTSDGAADDGTPLEADADEPTDEAAESTSAGHSDTPTPAPRYDRARDLQQVRTLVEEAIKSEATYG